MNLHEYQGKEILNSFGVRIQRGIVASTPAEAVAAAKKLTEDTGTGWHVIKAQVHAGGRGKGGGVKLAKNLDQVLSISDDILGMMLITPQTSAEGKLVNQVLICEDVYYPGDAEPDEYYMSVLLNRATGKNMIMYSTEGGMDIETVAEETPHLIFTEEIDPLLGIMPFQARKVAFNLGLSGMAFKEMTKFVTALYTAYIKSDSAMFEINPVLKTSDSKIMAVDAKVSLDENALYRHKDYAAMRDLREENPIEVEAKEGEIGTVKDIEAESIDMQKLSDENPDDLVVYKLAEELKEIWNDDDFQEGREGFGRLMYMTQPMVWFRTSILGVLYVIPILANELYFHYDTWSWIGF